MHSLQGLGRLGAGIERSDEVDMEWSARCSQGGICGSMPTGHLRAARDWAATAAADFGLAPEDCYQVKLAISEAVANAIQHGSSGQRDPIRISVQARADALVFDVWDTGVFDRDGEPAEELAEGGRGLEIVALMMDEMELIPGDQGTRLRFSKRRNGRPTDG